ncbi:hypothetical protein OQA88_10161 [Cercophora sp. LCS_1]
MASTDNQEGSESPKRVADHNSSPLTVSLLPKIPLIVRTALFNLLRISEQSKYLDLKTEVILAVLRSYLNPTAPISITTAQRLVMREIPIKGRIWISNYASPTPPDTGVHAAVTTAITTLSPTATVPPMPSPAVTEAEWTGYRAAATNDEPLPSISEREKYDLLMKETTSPTTILYLHGGAFWLMDPATHRTTTKRLAKLTSGRCYSVRYRLAPQNPFPVALIDALTSYLTLLYPPPDAYHTPVLPQHIVFAGDSAGGNLALSLLQTLLTLHRTQTPILWHGVSYQVPLPAGLAVNSPWLDITHSLPSCNANANFDYLPSLDSQCRFEPLRPACPAWPTTPPRAMIYAHDNMVLHPLVSPLLAESWKGAPPVWLCTGRELLADEDKFLAKRLWKDGVRVEFEEYEGMPHCFALIFAGLGETKRCLEGWAEFARRVVDGEEKIQSGFRIVRAKTLVEEELKPEGLSEYEIGWVRERIARRVRGEVEAKL